MEKVRILLVDDDRQNSEFLRKFLEVEGYEVSYAENGRKGWETFSAIRPDLVLLDVNMRPIAHFAGCDHVQIPILTRVSRVSNVSEHKSTVEIAQ